MSRHDSKKLPKRILVFTPLPWILKGTELFMSLLLHDHPMSSHELLKMCEKEGLTLDTKGAAHTLSNLKKKGVITFEDGRYFCRLKALQKVGCQLSERQILDLIGLTQSTVNGKAFYTSIPPMSVSSTNTPGSSG